MLARKIAQKALMHIPVTTYQKVTDYLAKYYDVELYSLGDLRHPVVFYPAAASQREAVDSVLGQMPGRMLTHNDFYIYDYGYLHSLQNLQAHLYNGTTFVMQRIRENPLRIDASFGKYFDMLATSYAMEAELLAAMEKKLVRLPLRSQL